MTGLYVYALADRKGPRLRLSGHAIEFVDVGGIYAAVEKMDASPPISEEALRAQHEIMRRIAESVDAVVPARFGSFVEASELERVVGERRPLLQQTLDLVRGRTQMTLRFFADPTATRTEPVAAPLATTGTAYLQQRRAASAGRPLPRIISDMEAAVSRFVVAARSEPGENRVVATLYHLIQRKDGVDYVDALAPFQDRADAGQFTVTGPWPAFAFAPELWP